MTDEMDDIKAAIAEAGDAAEWVETPYHWELHVHAHKTHAFDFMIYSLPYYRPKLFVIPIIGDRP